MLTPYRGDETTDYYSGAPWPLMKVHRRKYRFRILNASVSRSYRWLLSTAAPFTVIATDAGLMGRSRWRLRTDRPSPAGSVVLRNTSPQNNIDCFNANKVMAFKVVDDPFDPSHNEVPDALNPDNPTVHPSESDATRTRLLDLRRNGGRWTINGCTWDDVVASGYQLVEASPRHGDVEMLTIRNDHGGWSHPTHHPPRRLRTRAPSGRCRSPPSGGGCVSGWGCHAEAHLPLCACRPSPLQQTLLASNIGYSTRHASRIPNRRGPFPPCSSSSA
ncbi:MAG TPA: hypothetical protein VFJ97_10115 [Dermatophilaceae bacterium]|nr:hypothetical protein [Dermatophilaceae bacterium]